MKIIQHNIRLCYRVNSLIRKKAFPAIRISSIGYRIPKDSFNAWMLRQ